MLVVRTPAPRWCCSLSRTPTAPWAHFRLWTARTSSTTRKLFLARSKLCCWFVPGCSASPTLRAIGGLWSFFMYLCFWLFWLTSRLHRCGRFFALCFKLLALQLLARLWSSFHNHTFRRFFCHQHFFTFRRFFCHHHFFTFRRFSCCCRCWQCFWCF